jgi:hypothetical protein
MKTWSVPEVCMWLEKIGASTYCKSFLAQDVTGAVLEEASVARLQMLGVGRQRSCFVARRWF